MTAVLVGAALDYLRSHPLVLAGLILGLAVLGLMAALLPRRQREGRRGRAGWRTRGGFPATIAQWRALPPSGPGSFEHHIAELCRRDGCTDIVECGGAEDRAGDVRVRLPDGRRFLLQCKRFQASNKVASQTLYEVKGTYASHPHHCAAAAVVTTSDFTRSGIAWNEGLDAEERLVLFAADDLLVWARGGPPPWERRS
ncbi:restriction endonuclease [Streptomyces sp. NPDC003011]